MSITKFNKGSVFNVNFFGLEFVKLEDLFNSDEDQVYVITGLFINQKSKYGPRPFVSTPDFLADLPSHMLETVEEIISSPEIVEQINSRKAGFKVRSYKSKTYNKECYSVEFVDL